MRAKLIAAAITIAVLIIGLLIVNNLTRSDEPVQCPPPLSCVVNS